MDSPRHNHSLSDGSSSSEVPRSAALPPSQPQNYQAYIESGGSDDESGFGLAPGRVSTDQQAATEERSPRLSEEVWVSDSASARSVTEPRRQERRIDVRDMLSPSPSFPSLDSLRDRSPRRTRFSPHNHGRSRPRQHTRDDELYGPRSPSYGMNRDSQAFGHPDFDRPFFGTNNLPGYYPSAHPSYPFSPYRSEYAQPDYHGDFRRPSHAYESWDDYYGIHAARPHVYPSYHDNSRYQRMPAYHSQGQQPYHSQSSIGYTHRASAFEPIRNPSVILPPPEEVERPLSRRTQSSGQGPTDRDDDTIAGPLTNDWLHDSVYNPQPSWDAGAMPNSSRIVRKVKTSNAAPPSSSINENHEGQTSRAWLQAKTDFPDSNGSSELILSQNLECLEDGSRQTKVILTRTTVPEANTEPAQNPSPHMTWLHICRQTLSVDFLRRLISYCPTTIMGNSIKRVALMLLLECRDRLQHQFEGRKIFEAGANVRYTGILADDHTKETDPVIFLAIPYLSLQGRQLNSARTNDLQPLTLLQTLYGYDIDTERELYSPGSRLNPSTTVGEINVPQLWSMTIGSSILITMSSLSLDEICSGGITIDVQRPIVETCRVRLIPQDRDEIWFIIQRSSTLLNLRNQVAKRLRRKYRGASFDLFTDKLQLLAHDDWTSLMRSPLQNVTLHVRIMDMGMDMIDRTSTSKRLTSSVAPDQQLIPYRQSYNQLQHTRSRSHGQDNTNGTSLTGNKLATLAEIERYSTSGRSKPGPSQDLEIYQRGSPAPMHTMPLRRLESWRMLEWNDDAIQTSEDQLNLSNGHGHLPREKISVQFRLEEGPCEDASSDNTERSIPRISSITESWNASQQQLPDQSSNDAGASGLRNERPPGVNSGLTSRNSSHDALKDGNDSHYASESKMRTNPSVRRERNIESQNGEAEAEASSARLRAVWVSDPNGANARSHQSLSSLPGEDTNQRPNPSVPLPQFISATSWLPFFAWRTSQRSATEDDLRVIRQILTNIHQELTTMHNEKRLSKLYDKTYQCTYYRLRHRHLCWMEPLSRSTSGSISDLSSEPQRSSPANPSANNSDIPTADLSESPLPDDNTQSLAPHPRSMGTKRHDLTQMFSVSDKIVGLWVPDSSDIVHPLMNRYWGSLDRIFRQYYFASEYTDKLKSQQWFISKPHDTEDPLQRGQEKSSLPLTAYEECLPCKNMFTYSSAQAALEHFHTVHAACSFTKQDKAAFDDPCYVWLRTRDEQQTSSHLDAVARMNQTFTSRLDGVYQAARDLHSTVSQMDLSEDSPLLPTKLAQAFREIVMAHVLQAKCLSLMNEEMMTGRKKATKPTPGLSVRFGSNPLVEFTSRIQLINSKTDACFMKAATLIDETYHEIRFYSDQIVNGDNITMDQIGVEYLIAVIIGHLQSEGPDSTSRGIRDRFRKHMNRLQFEANRKPQRRVFLDLHALQEGLQGVLGVHESQTRLLHDYSILIKPDFDQKPDATRDTMWRLEVELMQKLSSRTRQHDREFHALMGRSELLRQQVKQSIEILEEGHGKAIRVFTIVTLFFLPLSFVSSFFGMNVADVRETTNSQALYWSIAIPITLGVVAIAFLYGYQWEGFLDLLRAAAQTVRKRRQSLEGRHRDFILNRLEAKSFVKFVETEKGRASETRRWQSSRSWWPWKQMSANGLSARFGKPQRADTGISLGE